MNASSRYNSYCCLSGNYVNHIQTEAFFSSTIYVIQLHAYAFIIQSRLDKRINFEFQISAVQQPERLRDYCLEHRPKITSKFFN